MQEIDISMNPISEISPKISQLAELSSFKANKCKLEHITHGIANLTHLRLIELKGNLLKDFLPKVHMHEIRLQSLEMLDLSNNQLTQIPSVLKHLKKLSTLILAYNQIKDIRKLCRKEFEGLYVVDLSNNKVEVIPNTFAAYLKSVQNINFLNNDIAKLPHNIGLLEQLKTIQVDGNPMKNVRRTIINKGSVGIISYLKQMYNAETDSQIEETLLDSDEDPEEIKMRLASLPKEDIKHGNMKQSPMEYKETKHQPMEYVEEAKEMPQEVIIVDNTARIEELTIEIDKLAKEIDENYSMPRPKLMEKKRLLGRFTAERAKLLKP
eukprot:TRINITY_DN2694_c0_g1_i9.p1 TRINITY_DN2694_c0_g1~~TRINITY_DN2694_c0_g1_i9.p1  ORF type:complete len:323 (-),score=86.16 TRINITY_DN2694_c0_g1_i9:85-1053(-)